MAVDTAIRSTISVGFYPQPGVEEVAFRGGAAATVQASLRVASTFARTTSFFIRYLALDALSWARAIVPGARAFAARLGVQWTRARESARD